MKQWQQFAQRYQQMSVRERVMVWLAGLFLIGFLLYFMAVEPTLIANESAQKQNQQLIQSSQDLELQISETKAALRNDPNGTIRQQLTQLEAKINQQDQRLGEFTVDLVSPDQMLPVLQNLLKQTAQIQLLSFSSNPPVAVLQSEARPDLGMFKHSVELHIKASYFQVNQFIKAIESSPWRFYWQSIHYEVVQYPNAEVRIELYTLSTSEDYIRV